MTSTVLRAATLSAMLALPLASFGQDKQPQGDSAAAPNPRTVPYGQGESKHCETMTGAEKDQCLKDEGAKTESKGPSDSAASGGSAAPGTDTAGAAQPAPAAAPEKKTAD
ncbi:MAG TPA: hypothetical protein VM183_03255 [Burkholderiales bacterium]|nr:hypothetical protein [Burkholderiales bacterium]